MQHAATGTRASREERTIALNLIADIVIYLGEYVTALGAFKCLSDSKTDFSMPFRRGIALMHFQENEEAETALNQALLLVEDEEDRLEVLRAVGENGREGARCYTPDPLELCPESPDMLPAADGVKAEQVLLIRCSPTSSVTEMKEEGGR